MAKLTIAAEIQEMLNSGAVAVADNKFSDANGNPMKVRNMDNTNDPLEIGDVVTIPADFKVILVSIGEAQYPCTVAEVKAADGSERNMRFFPNSLAKNIIPLDAEGKRMPKVKTTGKVAEWYAGFTDVNDAMKELAGKSFKVSGKETYSVRDYTTKEIRNTSVLSYDWV